MIIPEGAPASPCTERGADFAQVYQRHHAAVFAFAYRRTGDRMRAEDVAAQTFLQALQAYGRYEERGAPVMAWLLRIAANVICEQARRERRGPQVVSAAACPAGWDSSLGDGSCDWAERVERRAWIAPPRHALPRRAPRCVATLRRRLGHRRYSNGYWAQRRRDQAGAAPRHQGVARVSGRRRRWRYYLVRLRL